ncbi:MAG: DMT family transporter [Lachnospiraceae bacterium]|nr:DMT family transporter [Lachnospiraceae bacterium]
MWSWVLLTLFYGLMKGGREIVKKKALEISTVIEVLFFYTLIGFLLLLWDAGNAFEVRVDRLPLIVFKSFVIFVAWICGFKAIKSIPLGLYGLLDVSRMLFASMLGVIIIGERPGAFQIAGNVIVAFGLLMLGFKKKSGNKEEYKAHFVLLAFISAFLNAVSGTLDKILTRDVSSGQLQFWYMLFLLIFYGIYLLFDRTKADVKKTLKNYWIWILSIMFILADRALFMANAIPESKVTVMTVLKQSSVIVTILAGRLIFKEKGLAYKLLCAAVVLAGIIVSVL